LERLAASKPASAPGRLAAIGLVIAIAAMLAIQALQQLPALADLVRYSPGAMVTRVHMALAVSTVILAMMREQRRLGRFLVDVLLLLAFLWAMYVLLRFHLRFGPPALAGDTPTSVATLVLIAIVLYYTYRSFGLSFSVLGAVFVFYIFFPHYFPGPLRGPENDLYFVFRRLNRAMFGDPFDLAAESLWLLLFWGQMLTALGAGPAVAWISHRLARSAAGGPALGAVVSSAVVGSFTGAGAQGAAITGPIMIPSMRRAGYSPEMAAAVEATAANGASITPPVLGTVAFIMANILNMSYVLIIVMALIPALLWYTSVGLHLIGHARIHRLTAPASLTTETGERYPPGLLIRSAALGVVPIGALIYFIAANRPLDVAVWNTLLMTLALWLVLIVGWAKVTGGKVDLGVTWASARTAAVAAAAVSLSLAILAMVTSVMTFTGLGFSLGRLVSEATGGYAIVALGLMIVVGTVLAGPLPPVATYLIMAVTFAPVLSRMGVPYAASHFIGFYMGALATIVPPVAQSTLMASIIAGSNYARTNWAVVKIAWPLFIMPILFVAAPELLLVAGGPTTLTVILSSAGLALVGYAFGALATAGWLFVPMGMVARPFAWAVPLLAFLALYNDSATLGIAAVAVAVAVVAWQWLAYVAVARDRGENPFANGAIAGVSVRAMRGIGTAAGAAAVFLVFAWLVLAVSPLAPAKAYRYFSGIEGLASSINLTFAWAIAVTAATAAAFLSLARLRKGRASSSETPTRPDIPARP